MSNTIFINNSLPLDNIPKSKIICIISILEAYLNKVSKDTLKELDKTIHNLSLHNLSMIYSSILIKNSGLNGACWENSIFNAIRLKDDNVTSLLNDCINILCGENSTEDLSVILWGPEKKIFVLILSKMLSQIMM